MNKPRQTISCLFFSALVVGLGACASDPDSDAADSTGAGTSTGGTADESANGDTSVGGDTSSDDGAPTGTLGDTGQDDGPATEGESSSGTTGPSPEELLMCDDPVEVALPLFGPGIDPKTGGFVGEAKTYVVSTTQVIVPEDAVPQFDSLVGSVVGQLMMTPGLVGMSFASEDACGSHRTLSIWEDTAAMYTFVSSGAHAAAVGQTTEVSVTGRVTHWEIDAADGPPTWDEVLAVMDEVSPHPVYD